MSENVAHVTDHWWWRPGWRSGRHFYACHFTLDDQPELRALVGEYQAATKGLSMLDPIPPRWLHVTMQGIGFVDEISPDELAAIQRSLTDGLRQISPPTTSFEYPTIRPEAVYLEAQPKDQLYLARQYAYKSVLDVLGSERFSEPMPKPEEYTPHVSIAYANKDTAADPIAEALADVDPEPVTVTFTKVDLLIFHRDNRMYEWTSSKPIHIGNRGLFVIHNHLREFRRRLSGVGATAAVADFTEQARASRLWRIASRDGEQAA